MTWRLSHRADPQAVAIADRHYNRQKPGTPQFVPPGGCVVLVTTDGGALWVTSTPFAEYVSHAWAGAWVSSLFRREYGERASDLIRMAVSASLAMLGDPPSRGLVTFVDADKTRHKRDPCRCYRKAGFAHVGFTQGGLWAFQMLPDQMPEPHYPIGSQFILV